MTGLLENAGARSVQEIPFAPLFVEDLWSGLYTNRAALHDPSGLYERRYMGGRPGSLIAGQNVEVSVRNTIIRRPGLSPFSTATYPTPAQRAFNFEDSAGVIRVLVDTGSTGNLVVSAVANSSGGSTTYTGTFPNGGTNAYAGLVFQITGFTNAANNGTYTCTGSNITTLTLLNAIAVAETHAAVAVSAGAVFFDQQNGSKTLLKAKQPGAGQSNMVAVAGIAYFGDGVDTWIYTPGNPNGAVWGWGLEAPTAQPSVQIIESASAATPWTANTYWSTMGLINDGTNVHQLISVNASGTNTTQFGTTGSGAPAWNNTPGGTTSDNTITWTNFGPIVAWTANTTYNNASTGGTVANPCIIYDPNTKACYININPGGAQGTSSASAPSFKPGLGQTTKDGTVKWLWIGSLGTPQLWQKSHAYPKLGSVTNDDSVTSVVEPVSLVNGLPTNQTVYWQTSGGGTSASSATAPPWATVAGTQTFDGDMIWLCLGSKTWASNHSYSAWSANGTTFSAIVDSNGSFQVCTSTGTSGGSQPTWSAGYGNTTADGSVVWTCVGIATTWNASQKWFLPVPGFAPPSSSQPYGGASVIDSNNNVEFIVDSGLGGGSAPSWNSVGGYTVDNPTSLTLTQVAVSGGNAVYTGTITGGGSNALVGRQYLISGFTNAGNNISIVVTASSGTTLTCVATSQVNETHAGSAKTGAIWFNLEAFSANSLAWTKGYVYAVSFKSRALDDFYSTVDPTTGALPIPPGLASALPAPTGSLTGDVSTASPVFTITGANTGAVNTISGVGSTNLAVDTIVIWRSADGGGSANMFELTEIPAPKPIGGIAQPWSFQDFLPDTPTALYPGLNILIPAPIDDVNDPPPSSALPMDYNFQRIWCADGQQILFSGGPDTQVGNPNSCFAPADEFPFLSNIIRAVKSTQGLVVYTANSIEIILGGPATASFYSVTLAPGIGLGNYNALDVYMGEQFFMDTTGQLQVVSPTLSVTAAGFPVADELLKFNPKTAYITFADLPNDTGIYVGTGSSTYNGSTGWFRMAPRQIPGGINGPEPVWSPFAAITGGCQLLQAVEVSPGVKKLLVGSTSANQELLMRDPSVFTDNGSAFDAKFTVGSLWLARRGELAILKFVEADFAAVTTNPTVGYLLNEISGSFTNFVTANALADPPAIYGNTSAPSSYTPLRFFFSSTGSLARCVHAQISVDFGSTSNADEIFDFTIYGAVAKNF